MKINIASHYLGVLCPLQVDGCNHYEYHIGGHVHDTGWISGRVLMHMFVEPQPESVLYPQTALHPCLAVVVQLEMHHLRHHCLTVRVQEA